MQILHNISQQRVGEELDDLDYDLSDLSEVCTIVMHYCGTPQHYHTRVIKIYTPWDELPS